MRVEKPDLKNLLASQDAYRSQSVKDKAAEPSQRTRETARRKDTVEISQEARALFQESSQIEKPASAPTRASEGIKKALLDAELARDDEHAEKLAGKIVGKLQDEASSRAAKIEQAKSRVNGKFYDSPQVLEKIAEGLMHEMNLK